MTTERQDTLLHVFSTFAVGGQQRRFAQLANALSGYRHIIVAMDGDTSATSLLSDNVAFETQQVDITKSGSLHPGNIKRLRALIHKASPALLCTYSWGALEAVVANRPLPFAKSLRPHLHFEDGFGPEENSQQQLKRRVLARSIFLRKSKVVVPSRVLQSVAVERWQLPAEQVMYIPNGIDLTRYAASERQVPEKVTIGSVGALRREKNFPRLIRAVSALQDPSIQLLIAGDGPEKGNLETLIAQLDMQEQVKLVGHVDDPTTFYQSCDIFSLCSDTEQMPLTVLEAMATGLPVVATDVGDVRHMVADENANYVVARTEEAALPTVIERLVSNAELRELIGRKNREKAEAAFGEEQMLRAYDNLFQQLIDG